MCLRVRSLPDSGAKLSERQPLRTSKLATSSSMISLRVPAGSCQEIFRLRFSTSWQKSTTHSRFRIAVRSWKGKLVAPYFWW